jgi:hypothetical protein
MNNAVRRGEGREALVFYSAEAERSLAKGETERGVLALSRAMSVAWRVGELDKGLGLVARARTVIATAPAGGISGYARSSVTDLMGTVLLLSP